MNNKFWLDKRVLVTGGNGFVATHLIRELTKNGIFVVALVRNEKKEMVGEMSLPGNCKVEKFDVLNFDKLKSVCDDYRIDTIFHLASSSILIDSANTPWASIENNIIGSLNVLEVARINKIKHVVMASSYKAYGEHTVSGDVENLPYKENYSLRPLDAYSASKAGVDILAQTYFYQFGVPVIMARPCNIYGEGDLNFSRLIPKTIMRLLSGKAPVLNQGNDEVLKEFIYIDDVIRAYLLLAEKTDEYYGENFCHVPNMVAEVYSWPYFNIGSYTGADLLNIKNCGHIKNIAGVINILRDKITQIEPIVKEKPENFKEVSSQFSDSSKIIKLGFQPQVDFISGLDKTVAWYKKYYNDLLPLAVKYIN